MMVTMIITMIMIKNDVAKKMISKSVLAAKRVLNHKTKGIRGADLSFEFFNSLLDLGLHFRIACLLCNVECDLDASFFQLFKNGKRKNYIC